MRQRDGHDEACVIASCEDIEMANRLASEALGKSLDSLMPQTRQLLVLLDDYVVQRATKELAPRCEVRFTQRQLRETFSWSDRQLRRHLQRLVELEYVLMFRSGLGSQRAYQLIYQSEGRDGTPFLMGLIDTSKLRKITQRQDTGGQKGQSAPPPAGDRRPIGGSSAASKNGVSRVAAKTLKKKPRTTA